MNEVIVSVSAMKKTPTKPPCDSPFAEAFSRKLGRRISKSPSRLRPKARKRPATRKFSQERLLNWFKAVGPKKAEQITPTSVKTPMIARQ